MAQMLKIDSEVSTAASPSRVPWTRYRRILWPTDLSPLSMAALPHALGLAETYGAELALFRVLPALARYAVPDMTDGLLESAFEDRRVAAREQLRKIQAGVPCRVGTHVLVAEGVSPYRQIVEAARRLHCDVIVLATHGRTGLWHALLGSTVADVIRHTTCLVLTVPSTAPRAVVDLQAA